VLGDAGEQRRIEVAIGVDQAHGGGVGIPGVRSAPARSRAVQ
jgi:hypothetical protein